MAEDPRVSRSKCSILDATRALVSEHGFAGVTVEAIAERSGVAKTTIYRHWPDRNAIVMAVFADVATETSIPVTHDLRADLIAALLRLRTNLVSGHWATMFPAMMDAAERDASFRKLSQHYIDVKRRPIRRRLELAITDGELPAETDTELLLAMLAGPLFYRRYIARQTLNGAELVERIVDSALRGFGWHSPTRR